MGKLRIDLMGVLSAFDRQRIMNKAGLALFCLGVLTAAGAAGCSLSKEEDKVAPLAKALTAPAPAPAKEKPAVASAEIKEETLEQQAFKLQDLSVREEHGQTILQIKFSQPVEQYRHFPLAQPSRIVLDVFGETKRVGEAQSFRVDTHWVGTLRLNSGEGYLRFAVEITAATVPAYVITPDNGGLKVVIGAVNPNATAKKDVELVKGGKRVDVSMAPTTSPASEAKAEVPSPEKARSEEKKYTGQRISLDFKDADIKNVFRLLAEVSGLNIVVTDDVNKKVTVRLVEIPWDQAMDLLVETNGLGRERVGNVIRISTAGRLKTERDALAAAKKAEENLEPLQTAYFSINYARVTPGKDDPDKGLADKIKTVLSPRGNVIADQRTNTLIVRDIKNGIEEAQALVSRLDTRTPQVLIESNLIETTPTFSKALGIEMEALFNSGRVRASTRFAADAPFEGAPQPTPADNLLIIPNTGFRFGYFGNNITSVLSAAEKEGNVKIISRPSVVTLNNSPSTIESLNILRVRRQAATVGEAGAIEQIRVGITLTVTPQVSADGFVLLNIQVKSSSIGSRVVDAIPEEISREAKANVLVRDGETVVIGGIMKDTSSTNESGVPYLKDIPIVGWLFKKSSWQKDFEELVVFITPRVLVAGSENLPTAEQLWRDQMSRTKGAASAPPLQSP